MPEIVRCDNVPPAKSVNA